MQKTTLVFLVMFTTSMVQRKALQRSDILVGQDNSQGSAPVQKNHSTASGLSSSSTFRLQTRVRVQMPPSQSKQGVLGEIPRKTCRCKGQAPTELVQPAILSEQLQGPMRKEVIEKDIVEHFGRRSSASSPISQPQKEEHDFFVLYLSAKREENLKRTTSCYFSLH